MRVCVLDDNELVRDSLQGFLRALSHDVVEWVPEADRCEGRLLHVTRDVDVLLIDEPLARIETVEDLRQFHDTHPETETIVFNESGSRLPKELALALGVSGFMRKPVSLAELEVTLLRHQARRDMQASTCRDALPTGGAPG